MANTLKKFTAFRLCQYKTPDGKVAECRQGGIVWAEKAPNHNFLELENENDTLSNALGRVLDREKAPWDKRLTVQQLANLYANALFAKKETERKARGDFNVKEFKQEFDKRDIPYSEDWSVERFRAVWAKSTKANEPKK